MNSNKSTHRVRYADTDAFGVAYYARYLEWMEMGRAELLRENGATYSDYAKQGIAAPIAHIEVDYKDTTRYDDLITVETKITKIGNTSLEFAYIISKEDGTVVAEAKTVNVFMKTTGEKVRIPDEVRKIIREEQ